MAIQKKASKTVNNTASILKAMKATWKKASKRERTSFVDLEAGTYILGVVGGTLDNWGAKKKPAIKWDYVVQEGECAGMTQTVFENIETENNQYFVQMMLENLGYDAMEIDDLPEILEDINKCKPIVRARVISKDGFTNVRIMKLLEADGALSRNELVGEGGTTEAEVEVEDGDLELVIGVRVKLVESGNEYFGTVSADPDNDGSVQVVIDEIEEIWDVDIVENKVEVAEEEDDEPVVAKKKIVKKARAKKAKTIKTGSTVTFESGDDVLIGEVGEITDEDIADVEVADDEVYVVAVADLTLV